MGTVRRIAGYQAVDTPHPPCVVGIGIFDGVHGGHQALLKQVVHLAHVHRLRSLAYTFHPHPAQLLRPAWAPLLIESLENRLDHMEALGVEEILIEPFNRAFASCSAENFILKILVATLCVRWVVVGESFAFGHKQQGRVPLLQKMGQQHGFTVHVMHPVLREGIAISSTHIRECIRTGQMPKAAWLLGRPWCLEGRVIPGAHRGTSLGFPTANLQLNDDPIIPQGGVYAVLAESTAGTYPAVVNVGLAPTFEGYGSQKNLKIEAHLLDYTGAALYQTNLRLHFIERLRDEKRFESIPALQRQIQEDIYQARGVLLKIR